MREINGTFIRDLTRNFQNGYSIFLVNSENELRKTVKIAGAIPQYIPGMPLRLYVEENDNPQFKDTWKLLGVEETTEGLTKKETEQFLTSIGMPEASIRYLTRIDGNIFDRASSWAAAQHIGNGMSDSARQAWAKARLSIEQRKFHQLFVQTVGEKASPPYARTNSFVNDNRNVSFMTLSSYTYKVCIIDLGMHFKDVARLAEYLNSYSRVHQIEGMLIQCLRDQERNGSTCIPQDKLISQVDILCQSIGEKLPTLTEIDYAIRASSFVESSNDSISFNETYWNENRIAAKINEMRDRQVTLFGDDEIRNKIEEIEKSLNMQYAVAQKRAFNLLRHSGVSILTGGPGTGKTTSVLGLIKAYQSKYPDKKIVLCAPTGRAAQRMSETTGMEATTIHRLLGIGTTPIRNVKLNADLVICDESSMLDCQMAAFLLSAVPSNALVLLVGDCDQLPSVGCGDVFQDMILSRQLPVCKLETVFRQSGQSLIVVNANKINNGDEILDQDETFKIRTCSNDQELISQVKALLLRNPDCQFLCPSHKGAAGISAINKLIQDIVNPKKPGMSTVRYGNTEFRTGDKIILQRNNYDIGYYNGDMGVIKEIQKQSEIRIVLDNAEKKEILLSKSDIMDLALAYCISIHKSQGSGATRS